MSRRAVTLFALVGCYQAPVGGSVWLTPPAPVSANTLRIGLDEATDPNRNDRVEHEIYWYRNGEEQTGLQGAMSVPSSATERGDRWTVVVVPNDGIYDGDAFEAHTEIVNDLPTIEEVRIAPSPVYGGQLLYAEPRGTDGDRDDVLSYRYAWSVNGTVQSREATLSGLVRDDEVRLQVQVSDGFGGVDAWESDAIYVKNRVPSPPVLRLAPRPLSRDHDVRCEIAVDAVDDDGDEITYEFAWNVDGRPVIGAGRTVFPGDTLLASQLADATELECWVVARDHAEGSAAMVRGIVGGRSALVIYDTLEAGTPALVEALEKEGVIVTLSDRAESLYDGAHPAPHGFDAVIHLNGTTYAEPMPADGQAALRDYVVNGGTFIHSAWNAYEAGSTSTLAELAVTGHDAGGESAGQSFTKVGEHPLTDGLAPSFRVEAMCGYGSGRALSGTTTVATVSLNGSDHPGVLFRPVGAGRSIGLATAANYVPDCLTDEVVQRLYVNAVWWGD